MVLTGERGEPVVRGGHIRWVIGTMNMATFSAARTAIRTVKGTIVESRRPGVRYLRCAIRLTVYKEPARPRASRANCSTWIVPLPTRAVGPLLCAPNRAVTV